LYHMGIKKPKIAHAQALKEAYNQRLVEFENKKTIMEKE